MFPWVFKESVTMLVSFRRITEFLNGDELSLTTTMQKPQDTDTSVKMSNCSFSWNGSAQLTDIDIEVSQGQLTAIVGVVGSGKSSMLQGKPYFQF